MDATSPARLLPRGATLQVPVYVVRAEDVTADVALSVTAPPGFGATLSAPVVGPDAAMAAITVVVPPSPASGTYSLGVPGTIGDVTRHVTVKIQVDGDVPAMPSPRLTPLKGSRFDTTSYLARVSWVWPRTAPARSSSTRPR